MTFRNSECFVIERNVDGWPLCADEFTRDPRAPAIHVAQQHDCRRQGQMKQQPHLLHYNSKREKWRLRNEEANACLSFRVCFVDKSNRWTVRCVR